MNIFFLTAFALTGIVTGLLSGFLGVSGSILVIPILYTLFGQENVPQDYRMHLSIGTSIAAMLFNSLGSCMSYNRRHLVRWETAKKWAIPAAGGSFAGAILAGSLSTEFLCRFFALFLLGLSLYVLIGKKKPRTEKAHVARGFIFYFLSLVIGAISNVLGIGGGVMLLPFLLYQGLPEKQALGTGSAISIIIMSCGSITYMLLGLKELPEAKHTLGFIYLPAFYIIGILSFLLAPLSVKIAVALPAKMIRKIIALVMIIVAIRMGIS